MPKDVNSPATTSEAYDRMQPRWIKIQTVLDGTEAMRDAGRDYLPQHENETDEAWLERKEVTTLLNLSKLTLDSWVGRPFSEPLILNDDVPNEIRELEDDVDMLGNAIQTFARNWFREGLAKGVAHVMVEMPASSVAGQRTLADDREEGMRPYWVHIKPEQIFFADAVVQNGEEILTELRMMEMVTTRVGFAAESHRQIRQYLLVRDEADKLVVQLTFYRENKEARRKEEEWIQHGAVLVMDIDRIPLVSFYAQRDGLMESTPPLEDVVDLNIAHFQSTSDQRAVLTVARFPIITVTGGVDDYQKITIGPKKILVSPDASAKFDYLEHSGIAIESGRSDIRDLEGSMGDYGSEYLKKRPGRETATARTLDSAEATSALQDVTFRFMDAMQTVLLMTAKWLGLPEGGTVDITTDFVPGAGDQMGLTVLLEARKLRDISRVALLRALQRQKMLPEDFDADADMMELEDEALLMPLGMDPTPAKEPDDSDDDDKGGEE